VAGFSDYENGLSGYMTNDAFGQMSDYQLLKEHYAPRS
jgi:hypothetical protein